MKYTRIYADAAGESHLQDVDAPMKPAGVKVSSGNTKTQAPAL